jgi:enamine deaminase RidA (YjgF/YER057c/UK114 family)
MSDIVRLKGSVATRSQAVAYGGLVFTVATASEKTADFYAQMKSALAAVDRQLAAAKSDKTRVLSVVIYIADIARKAEINRAWDEWADPAHAPMRACVQAGLEGADLVELVVTAAAR